MPITLLLDLDDTLLDTNVDAFLPAYYEALARHLSTLVRPEEMLAALRSGIKKMTLNQDPSRTLQEVFESDFYPRLNAEKDLLLGRIMGFYRDIFPSLRSATRPRPGAQELIEWARSAGHRVAVATDPLFPMVATLQRVSWAGLDPGSFELISSFETFHFTKAHPAYFAEVLGRLGWPDRPVLMAGNDVERDLQPAERLGLMTFHVTGDGNGVGGRSGDLVQLREWITANEAGITVPAINTQEAVLAVLGATPAVLMGMTAGFAPAEWVREPAPDEWAIIELVCHLRDTEREVHAPQITALIESSAPFVARPDAAVWAKQRRYQSENGPDAVRAFAAARRTSLERLRSAPPEAWAKPARHAIFGPTNFLEVIGFMAEHDRLHLQQAWRTIHAEQAPAHRK